VSDIHILILINSLTSGGAERVTVNLSSYLVEKGYKVTVVTVKKRGRDFFKLDKRVTRIYITPDITPAQRICQSDSIMMMSLKQCMMSLKQCMMSLKQCMMSLKQYIKRFTVLRMIVRQLILWGFPFNRLSPSQSSFSITRS